MMGFWVAQGFSPAFERFQNIAASAAEGRFVAAGMKYLRG